MDPATTDRFEPSFRPRLRPVEAYADPEEPQDYVIITDPLQLAGASLKLSIPALHILALMDGTRSIAQIEAAYREASGHALQPGLLAQLVGQLEETHFLQGPAFEAHYEDLQASYRSRPRRMNDLRGLGLSSPDVAEGLDGLLRTPSRDGHAAPLGLIAPHLDYERGRTCYEAAYAALLSHRHFERFVILGTNHFGRSLAAVATANSFETPLGTTDVDTGFLERLEQRCGQSLRRYEMDHAREHSIELQVLLLQHLLGPESFSFVPVLCPDPCGPTGTAPLGGIGVDLQDFAEALKELLREDDTPTCLLAGADLSHTGAFFGEDPQLDDAFLAATRQHDEAMLGHVLANDPQQFVAGVAASRNHTRICSAGCIFVLMSALPGDARPRLLRYHQAVNQDAQCSVSCAAVVFEPPE